MNKNCRDCKFAYGTDGCEKAEESYNWSHSVSWVTTLRGISVPFVDASCCPVYESGKSNLAYINNSFRKVNLSVEEINVLLDALQIKLGAKAKENPLYVKLSKI